MEATFFGRKGEWCSHQRRIQNLVEHRRWKIFFYIYLSEYAFGHYTDSLV